MQVQSMPSTDNYSQAPKGPSTKIFGTETHDTASYVTRNFQKHRRVSLRNISELSDIKTDENLYYPSSA